MTRGCQGTQGHIEQTLEGTLEGDGPWQIDR